MERALARGVADLGFHGLDFDEGATAVILAVGAGGGGIDEDGQDAGDDRGDGKADLELDERHGAGGVGGWGPTMHLRILE